MLIEYPTPALAAEHLRRIDAAHHAAQPQAGVATIENVGPFFDKRTGPIVAIAAGPLSQSDAQTLLGAVNWDASVTWNENTYFDKKNNIANLLVNIILLCIIVGAISLAAGVAFGGARVLLRRFFPGPVFRPSRPNRVHFPRFGRGGAGSPRLGLRPRPRVSNGLKCLRNIGLGPVSQPFCLKLKQLRRVLIDSVSY